MDQPISVVWVEVSVLLEALNPLKCVSILPNDLIYIYIYIYDASGCKSPTKFFFCLRLDGPGHVLDSFGRIHKEIGH